MQNADAYGKPVKPFPSTGPSLQNADGQLLLDMFARMLQGGLSRESGITATPGGTKAAARVLKRSINIITVCATAADSVLLPKAIAGSVLFLTNAGAASAQVFGKGTDTINGVATATGVAQGAGLSAVYVCAVSGAWFRILSA
jgi:hypothetical protein